jgi:hypothetical protein
MKIISSLLETIEGIQIWYIAGLLIFFILFILFTIRAFLYPKQEIDEIKNSIFDDENDKITT